MGNSVRLAGEVVLVIVLIIALFLYFSQQQQVNDAEAALASVETTATALAAANTQQANELATARFDLDEAGVAAAEQSNAVATAQAQALEQSNLISTARAEASEEVSMAMATSTALADALATAQAEVEAQVQEAADAAATVELQLELAGEEILNLQSTIEALSITQEATAEPTQEAATEETATEEAAATEPMAEVAGFNAETFSMPLPGEFETFDLASEGEAALATIEQTNEALATRIRRESAQDYAALLDADAYVLVNQQPIPQGVSSVSGVADVAFRRAQSSEIGTLGEHEVARGIFSENEVRYILFDAGSMWVITFVSDDVETRLEEFDEAVAGFAAVEPPAEE